TITLAVPDPAGVPPSIAVRIKLKTAWRSRSKAFAKIKSASFDPSLLVWTSKVKCSLSLR
ncbi:hypothetical protein NL108_014070, partial [Boleophthalmus pectinirostris]